jgi:hypothetical protein
VSKLRKRRQEKEVPGRCPLLEVGHVVLYKPPVIGKEATPMKRITWRMARIAKMHPGCDGRVRNVDLELFDKGKKGWTQLPQQSIRHLAPLKVALACSEKQADKEQNAVRPEREQRKIEKKQGVRANAVRIAQRWHDSPIERVVRVFRFTIGLFATNKNERNGKRRSATAL